MFSPGLGSRSRTRGSPVGQEVLLLLDSIFLEGYRIPVCFHRFLVLSGDLKKKKKKKLSISLPKIFLQINRHGRRYQLSLSRKTQICITLLYLVCDVACVPGVSYRG